MADDIFEDVGQFAARCRNCGYIYNSVAWLLNSMWICCPHCGYGVRDGNRSEGKYEKGVRRFQSKRIR